ncbi:hypothetical protein HELRODRAFT_96415 [Helobdella robusta]|uniref:DNA/RNA-binding domain-containing protein n=1 Tax=Helobdella robusta TaxID=6412 RepID=T1G9B9_HELRO|nr:hypothetical protein HELRODRAFT_96415 [Helobdella robusta]ESN91761.1 hypothetical protein HELRODRAFT_96415 [Helobdella robusta]
MSSIDLFKQAENLKLACNDTTKGPNEVWKSRQLLQEIYQTLLTTDLEFALDKKVEQDLWKYTFKKQISSLQCQGKDNKQGNLRKGEVQAGLNLFLKAASGFYLQLLQELTCWWKMDTPFNKQPYCIGIIKEYPPIRTSKKFAHLNSYMYICQDCLVHLGDISRYRDLIDQAQFYYKHAARLAPFNGQPYNQLAILEVQRGNKLSAVFYHMRGLALIHPFPVSEVNLMKFFNKISKDSYESRQKLASNEWISFFLQFHATIFLNLDLNKSEIRLNKILSTFNNNLESTSGFSGLQLIQICAINFYQCYCLAKRVATKSNDKKNAFNINQSGDSKKVSDVTGRSGCETDVTGRSGCQDHLVGNDGDESRTLKVLLSEDARGCSGSTDGEVRSNRWGLEGEVEDMIDDSFVFDEVRNIPHHGDHLDSTAHKERCVDARDVQYKKQLIMVTDLTVAILNQMLEKCCEAATTNEQNGCSEFNDFALETVFPSVKSCLEWLVINLEMLHDCTNVQTVGLWSANC